MGITKLRQAGIAGVMWLVVVVVPPAVLASKPSDVSLAGPGDLLGGLGVRPKIGGTYYQQARVVDDTVKAVITFQLPAIPGAGQPGPVVFLWQGGVAAVDRAHGDTLSRAVGSPQTSAVLPNCDAVGNCALRVEMEVPTAPAYQAADNPSLDHVGMGILVSAVRTFEGTDDVQVVQPGVLGSHEQGSLARPVDRYGALYLLPLLSLDSVWSITLRGDELGRGSNERYDWAAAVRRAIAEFDPPPQPEPVPIAVWTPDKDDVRRVIVDLAFSVGCPEDRVVVIRNDTTGEVVLSLNVGGATNASADVALPTSGLWTFGLYDTAGRGLNAIQLSPTTNDVVITGPLRCTNGKGVINEEGVPLVIPNPSGYASPSPTEAPAQIPAGGANSDSAAGDLGLGIATGVLALGLIMSFGLLVLRRAQPRQRSATDPRKL